MQVYSAQAAPRRQPNDPLFAAQPAARQWQLAKLHRLATGSGVRVAVIDSGIDASHPDLAGQVAVNRNFVAGRPMAAEQHGTGVAGIIAARAGNGIGLAGIAPGARSSWACAPAGRRRAKTLCDSFSLAKALYFAIDQKAPVINMSLSGPDDRLLRQLLKIAMGKGETVVAAFDRTQRRRRFSRLGARRHCRVGLVAWQARGATCTLRRAATCPPPSREDDGSWSMAVPLRRRMSAACSR